jgi:multiple sugar transport system ATP-binding protein
VALGRAIVRDPAVFLFDEPLSNLDAKMRVQMRTELSRLHHRLGATMVYVTHDQTEAMTLGQRIVVMHRGIVQQVDTPLALYSRPANRFVAGFIGSPAMNFLTGRLQRQDGLRFVAGDGETLRLPEDFSAPAHRLDTKVDLGVRPEHVLVDPGAGAAGFEATVQVVEPLGNETLMYFTVADRPFVVRCPGQVSAAVGQPVRLGLQASHLHLFDPADGRNLLAGPGRS